jgi:hypothetical protein
MRILLKILTIAAIGLALARRPGGSDSDAPGGINPNRTPSPPPPVGGFNSGRLATKASFDKGEAGAGAEADSTPTVTPDPSKGPVPGQARNEAQEYANMQRRPPGPDDPKTVAVMIDPDGNPVYGESGGTGPGQHDPAVQEALDNVPPENREPWHGECAEITALDRFRPSRNPVEGSTISAARVRGPNSAQHGSAIPPCRSCASVLEQLGITDES